jgi:hypothetical protein
VKSGTDFYNHHMQSLTPGVILAHIGLIQEFADKYLAEARRCTDDQR